MIVEQLHWSSLDLNVNSKQKLTVTDGMEGTSSLKGTKHTDTEFSYVTLRYSVRYPLKKDKGFHRFVAAK
jgi:hypothetical protein